MLRNIKTSMSGNCVADSLVNAIKKLVGRKAAFVAMSELGRLLSQNISAEELRSSTTADLEKCVRACSFFG